MTRELARSIATIPSMHTAKDVVLCAGVAAYLFVAMAVDLRLLILPSVVAMLVAAGFALAGRDPSRPERA